MRKINVIESVSLDGFIDAPAREEGTSGSNGPPWWIRPYRDPVSGATVQKQMDMPFDLLLGASPSNFGQNSGPNIMTFGRALTQPPSTSPRIP
jgi:hypothetical protein